MPSKILILLLGPVLAAPVYGRVNISTAQKSPVVAPGGTLQFRSNGPVKWSLAPGSVGEIDRDGTYHAPPSVPAKNVLAGCQLLGNDHIFNTRIDNLPVHPNSAAWMSIIPQAGLGYSAWWGTNIADAKTPKQPMHFLYTPQNDGVFELVPWPELKRESGVFTDPHSPLDRHVLEVNRDTCLVSELYNNYDKGVNTGCPACTANSGYQYHGTDDKLPAGSVDAAGLLIGPLTLRLEELRSGAIEHALRVTFKNNIIAPQSMWPSHAHAGAWGKIPYGARLRLKAGFDTSRFGPYAKTMLTELKEYGLFIADGGGNWDINLDTDTSEDPAVADAIGEIGKHGPRTSDFEIVDEKSLIGSDPSGAIKIDNPYAKPDGYAVVVATGDGGDVARARVVIQSITVGVPNPSEWIQSGVEVKLPAWVNGTDDKRLRWSMAPSLGSLTPEGVYSAPKVDKPTRTMLTVASAADPKSETHVALTVMPPGDIRVKVGNATGAPGAPNRYAPDYGPDSDGHMWWRDQAGEVTWGVVNDDWHADWPKVKDVPLFYTSRYALGDMVYRLMVPNGRYKIDLLIAQPNCTGTFNKGWRIPFRLEAQGKLVVPYFDMGAGIGYACRVPVVASIPAEVTDNHLYFALRRFTDKQNTPSPLLNGFDISRDDSAPHLSVNPEKVTALNVGQQIQFTTIGWGMTNKATWAVVKGPGTVTPGGLYTAPAVPPASEQPVMLEAKSASDPSKTTTAEMVFKFGEMELTPGTATIARSLSQKFAATIDGTPYTNVNWSIDPQSGSIAPDGTYTAPDSLSSDVRVTVKATSKDVQGKSAASVLTVKAALEPIRINCGSTGALKDAQANVWAADYGFSPSMAYHANAPIAGASPDLQPLYQSARYAYAHQNFNYSLPVPNGRYAVTLKFADYTFNEAGHYLFDVLINGKKVLTAFDPDRAKAPKTAVDERFETTVTNKTMRIDINAGNQSSLINGLELEYLGN